MKVKLYAREWFYNAGLVGFIRILEHNSKRNFVEIEDNCIEFDTKVLKDFHHDYFKCFFDTYDVAKRVTKKVKDSFDNIKNNLDMNEENQKEKKDAIKKEKKYIKTVIKTQLDKVKKINEDVYNKMLVEYNKIDKVETKEEFDNIQAVIIEGLAQEDVNKRNTLNLFKSILSKNYFGQQSFLNVSKNSLTYEEQEELMYKDYVSNIIELDFMQDIVEGKYNIDEIKSYIERIKSELLTKEVLQIYNNLMKKYVEKGKTIEEIQDYIQKTVFSTCYMCENEHAITNNYSEGNFVPLAISSDNMKNFFWNQNADFPVCDLCKLILFCIPVGVTIISKVVKEQDKDGIKYKEKEILSFVNDDTSINKLIKINDHFSGISKKDKKITNPYSDLILSIVEQNTDISRWQLENIFVVEFETEYGAYSMVQYFNIKRYVATFFTEYAEKLLTPIKDYSYKIQIVDDILKNRSIKYVINDRLRDEVKKGTTFGFYSYLATKCDMVLQILKKEEEDMEEEIGKNNAKLTVLYNLGLEIHAKLKKEGEENKIDGYAYKMLNSIRVGNKQELMDTILRIHMALEKEVSPIFIEIMKDTNLGYEAIGHSFLAGLISNKKEEKEEVK